MAQHQVLFCPFCRDSFEGLSQCPEHELALVPLARLPAQDVPDAERDDDPDQPQIPRDLRPLGLFDPSLARGWVALGAGCELAALALPLLADEEGGLPTYQLARVIPSLWTFGLVGFTVLYTLARRRTPRGLRGLRVLMPGLGAVALLCLAWAFGRLGWSTSPGTGTYLVIAGALCLAAGGARLGGPATLASS